MQEDNLSLTDLDSDVCSPFSWFGLIGAPGSFGARVTSAAWHGSARRTDLVGVPGRARPVAHRRAGTATRRVRLSPAGQGRRTRDMAGLLETLSRTRPRRREQRGEDVRSPSCHRSVSLFPWAGGHTRRTKQGSTKDACVPGQAHGTFVGRVGHPRQPRSTRPQRLRTLRSSKTGKEGMARSSSVPKYAAWGPAVGGIPRASFGVRSRERHFDRHHYLLVNSANQPHEQQPTLEQKERDHG